MQVWTKNILYWFIDSQTHLVCQEVLQWVWPSMNQNRLLFVQIQPLSPSMQPKWKEIFDIVCKATNGKSFANSRKKVPLSRKMVLIHHLFSRNQSLATRSVFMVVCYAMEKALSHSRYVTCATFMWSFDRPPHRPSGGHPDTQHFPNGWWNVIFQQKMLFSDPVNQTCLSELKG